MATVEQRLATVEKACIQLLDNIRVVNTAIATLQQQIKDHEARLDKQGGSVKQHEIDIKALKDTAASIDETVKEEVAEQTRGQLWDKPA